MRVLECVLVERTGSRPWHRVGTLSVPLVEGVAGAPGVTLVLAAEAGVVDIARLAVEHLGAGGCSRVGHAGRASIVGGIRAVAPGRRIEVDVGLLDPADRLSRVLIACGARAGAGQVERGRGDEALVIDGRIQAVPGGAITVLRACLRGAAAVRAGAGRDGGCGQRAIARAGVSWPGLQPAAIRPGDGEVGDEVAQVELVEHVETPRIEVGEFQLSRVVRGTHLRRVHATLRRVSLARRVFALPGRAAADLAGGARIAGLATSVEGGVVRADEAIRHAGLVLLHVQAGIIAVGWTAVVGGRRAAELSDRREEFGVVRYRSGREVGEEVEIVDRPLHLEGLEDHRPCLVDVGRERLVVGVDQGDDILEVTIRHEVSVRARCPQRRRCGESRAELAVIAEQFGVEPLQRLDQGGAAVVLQALPDVRCALGIAEVRADHVGQLVLEIGRVRGGPGLQGIEVFVALQFVVRVARRGARFRARDVAESLDGRAGVGLPESSCIHEAAHQSRGCEGAVVGRTIRVGGETRAILGYRRRELGELGLEDLVVEVTLSVHRGFPCVEEGVVRQVQLVLYLQDLLALELHRVREVVDLLLHAAARCAAA